MDLATTTGKLYGRMDSSYIALFFGCQAENYDLYKF